MKKSITLPAASCCIYIAASALLWDNSASAQGGALWTPSGQTAVTTNRPTPSSWNYK